MLKALTINIWNRQGPWDRRLSLLQKGVRELEPDVIGLQEVMSDGASDLASDIGKSLGYHLAFGVAKPLGGGVALGNAVLSRFPIRQQRVFPLPAADTDEQRSLLVTDLETPDGMLPFATTHLAWKFHHGYIREQQVLEVARVLKEHVPIANCLPAVIVGDFNAAPDATEIRFLRGVHALHGTSTYLADCFGDVGNGPGYTYDETRNPYAALIHEAPRRIDYVFVRGPDSRGRGKPIRCRVVLDEVEDGVAPSDHFGVLAEIRMTAP